MRTTLDIADDVLLAAKDVAKREKCSLGQVVTQLARQALLAGTRAPGHARVARDRDYERKLADLGITPLPRRGSIVSDELVKRLREEQGI